LNITVNLALSVFSSVLPEVPVMIILSFICAFA
jgi:hypothetical protein